jgi:hypothetical protein
MTFELKLKWVQIEWNLNFKMISFKFNEKNGIQIDVKNTKCFSCNYGVRIKKHVTRHFFIHLYLGIG